MNDLPIKTDISVADSTIKSFRFDDLSRSLYIYIEAWNSKNIELICSDVLYFKYQSGDVLASIYSVGTDLSILNEAVSREYEDVPESHPYKLYEIRDISDFPVVTIVTSTLEFKVI